VDYLPHIPQKAPVAPAVELLFHLRGYVPGHSRERLVPDGRMNLVIELDGRERHVYDNDSGLSRQVCRGSWLSGVHSDYITIGDTDSESILLVVQFAPGGSLPFTHTSAAELCDVVVPAETIFGGAVLTLREELLALDEALHRLEAQDPAMAQVVKLRYFAGLTVDETAKALATSSRSVNRLWMSARAWLRVEMSP